MTRTAKNRAAMSGTAVSGIAAILAVIVCTSCPWPALAEDQPNTDETQPASGAAASEAPQNSGKSAEDEAGSDGDLMKQFTRHRPGGCPEGPPCSFED